MIQYKITFKEKFDGTTPLPICGEGVPLGITLYNGYPKLNGDKIEKIFFYYSQEPSAEFVLACQDATGDASVQEVHLEVIPRRDPVEAWPQKGGCRWERTAAGVLQLHFTPPEVVDAAYDWTFNPKTPPVVLKIKIKRQDQGFTAATACANWSE